MRNCTTHFQNVMKCVIPNPSRKVSPWLGLRQKFTIADRLWVNGWVLVFYFIAKQGELSSELALLEGGEPSWCCGYRENGSFSTLVFQPSEGRWEVLGQLRNATFPHGKTDRKGGACKFISEGL